MHLILSFLQVLEMAISVSVKLYKRVKGKSKFRLTRDFCFLLPLLFLRCGLYSVFSSDSIDLAQLIVALYEGPGQKFLEYRAFSDLLACKPQITASQLADKQAFKPTSSSSLWRPGTTSLAEQQPLTGLRPINIGYFSEWLLIL
jgi:hypothetical protein